MLFHASNLQGVVISDGTNNPRFIPVPGQVRYPVHVPGMNEQLFWGLVIRILKVQLCPNFGHVIDINAAITVSGRKHRVVEPTPLDL